MRERGPGAFVTGGGGTRLHVLDTGNPRGQPLLFIHGYCQSTYAWRKQLDSDLARDFRLIAFDLRAHGLSDKPQVADAYVDSQLWADDVAAVLDSLDLRDAVVVGWSYAGYLIGDYLRHHGAKRLGALALVGAVTLMGGSKARGFAGPRFVELFPQLFSAEMDVLRPVMTRFIELCVADPAILDARERAELLEIGALVPAVAREAMQRRKLDNDDVLHALALPVACMHGTADAIILPASSEHNARTIPRAVLSIYDRIGHSPFVEDPVRFNRELRELAARVVAS